MTAECDILCVGAAHWDVIGRSPWRIAPGGDLPGLVVRSPGGVALNIALALAGQGLHPALLSVVGGDADGTALLARAAAGGVATGHVHRIEGRPTDRYVGIEDPTGLVAAIADNATLEAGAAALCTPLAPGGPLADWRGPLVLDGNLPVTVLAEALRLWGPGRGGPILAPPSPAKAARLRALFGHPGLTLYANLIEAAALTGTEPADSAAAARALCRLGVVRAVITDGTAPAADAGPHGLVMCTPPAVPVARVTGAGDCFIAGHVAAVLRGAPPETALAKALDLAAAWIGGAA
jgi:pseudouridine kinase